MMAASMVPASGVPSGSWATLRATGSPRSEVGFVRVGGRLFLLWGGNMNQAYTPLRDRWRRLPDLPADLDHIQAVTVDRKIYSLGGFVRGSGNPKPPAGSVWIFDPATGQTTAGTPMPEGRERGAGGVVRWKGELYYLGGVRWGVAVPWVDVYDPVADEWRSLPDMPRARDHFHPQVVRGVAYVTGGRAGDPTAPFGFTDALDLATGTWTTGLAPMPTPRGGYASAVVAGRVVVIGGEGAPTAPFDTVEAYDPATDTWSTWAPMPTARHGIQAAVWNGTIFVAAGGTIARSGKGASDVLEVLTPPAVA